jgi:hypothetical protein
MEVESASSLAFICREADGFTRNVALLEGELADARQGWDTTEANVQGLSNKVADINWQWEDAERQFQDFLLELTLLQTRDPICAWP